MFHKLICQCHFHGPPEIHGPSNGPPKLHGPRGHCPPCAPSRLPCLKARLPVRKARKEPFFALLFLSSRRSGGPYLGFRAGSF